MNRGHRSYHSCLLATLLALCLGCADDVAAPTGVDEPFSMFGILNPRLNTQTMLVSPVQSLLYDYPDSLDAMVTSTDLQTGERQIWNDSVVVGDAGHVDHVYVSNFRPAFGSRHRIDVRRSDGATSSVEVDVPVEVTVEQEDTRTRILHAYVRGGDFRLIRLDAVYYVRHHSGGPRPGACSINIPQGIYAVSYLDKAERTDDGWRVEIDLGLHYERVHSLYHIEFPEIGHRFPAAAALMKMRLDVTVGNDAWDPPGGEFDDRVLSRPGTLRNVEHGFGFVGGGYNQDRALYPSKQTVADTPFYDYVMRPPNDCLDYCSCGYR